MLERKLSKFERAYRQCIFESENDGQYPEQLAGLAEELQKKGEQVTDEDEKKWEEAVEKWQKDNPDKLAPPPPVINI